MTTVYRNNDERFGASVLFTISEMTECYRMNDWDQIHTDASDPLDPNLDRLMTDDEIEADILDHDITEIGDLSDDRIREIANGASLRWRVTAEHTQGKSVDHPCTSGVYSDPANDLDLLDVTATTPDEAERHGIEAIQEACDEREPCNCRRHLSAGSEAWWNSVAVHVVPE
jgi:hypothetical protein